MSSDPEHSDLIERARRAALENDTSAVYAEYTERLRSATGPVERGSLLLSRSILTQGAADPVPGARDARAAWELLRATGAGELPALAAAIASGMQQRCGELADSVDLGVEAMVLLADQVDANVESIRTYNALAIVFGQMCAFDLAVPMSERAFRASIDIETSAREIVGYTLCYVATEGTHILGADAPSEWVDDVGEVAKWIRVHAATETGQLVLAIGVQLEHAILRDDRAEMERLVAGDDGSDPPVYAATALRILAWHRLVRGAALHRVGRSDLALPILDSAVVALERVSDEHRLARALRERAQVKVALGDHEGAVADALALSSRCRTWQADQVGRLAAQMSRRAELERTSKRLHAEAEQLAERVSIDTITGVKTRQQLEVDLDALTERTGIGAVIVLDLDRFKSVNDGYGHHVGDAVLGRVGTILRDHVRRDDVVARYGGEEFVIAMPGASTDDAAEIAERVRTALHGQAWDDVAPGLVVTLSAGIAGGGLDKVRQLVRTADAALYRAKRAGRNRVAVESPTAML